MGVIRLALASAILAGVVSFGSANALLGQAPADTQRISKSGERLRRVSVTIVLVDTLPTGNDLPAAILRRKDRSPRDVILLRRDGATGAHLSAAIFQLMIMRDRAGDTASSNAMFRLPRAKGSPKAWERTEQVRADRALARLRRSSPREIPGVGRVRAIDLYLPSRAMRDDARRAHPSRVRP